MHLSRPDWRRCTSKTRTSPWTMVRSRCPVPGRTDRSLRPASRLACASLALWAVPVLAGPPYLTDDPDPVDYGHLEVIPFYSIDRAGDGSALQGPGADISYGILPEMHLNLVPVFVHTLPD